MRTAPPLLAVEPSVEEGPRAFWRTLVIISIAHLGVVLGFYVADKLRFKPKPVQVLWLDSGAMGGAIATAAFSEPEPPTPEPEPEPEPAPKLPPPPPALVETAAPSEIVEPKATPEPATPKPATPRPATPKPATPRPATPKPKPKETKIASAKPAATPKPGPAVSPKPATPTPKKLNADATGPAKADPDKAGGDGATTGAKSGAGKGGSGTGGTSEFGWYFQMIDDRFRSRWAQPVGLGVDVVTTVKLRIMKDGTIALREMVRSSGNPQMDESVMSAAAKVQQVDPLPAGLGNGESFELNVAFKIDQ